MANFDGFSVTVPSGTSAVSDGDNDMRSTKSYMKEWWEQEHYATDGSSASAGVHKEGSARAWSQSAAPTAVNIGQLWHDSDDDAFYVAEAAGTGSWTQISASVTLSSVNTWTALNNFSSNITVADITVTSAVDRILSGTRTIDVASIAAHFALSFDITVTGATTLSPVAIGRGALPDGLFVTGFVNTADNVRCIVHNNTASAINPGSFTYNAVVFNHTN